MVRQRLISAILALFVVSFWPSSSFALNEILNIRHWVAPDHTRVVIDAAYEPQYSFEKDEQRLTVHLFDTVISKSVPSEIILNKPGINKIRVTSPFRNSVNIELSLTDHAETNLFALKKFQQKPDRIVIDISFPDVEKKENQEREQVRVLKKEKIIVIDPGHGGEDPGAIGQRGTNEKDVVLDIAKRLKFLLDKRGGYRAFLTRNGDYYVPFKKRLKIAREYGADLFLSIHADASMNRQAMGSSVYCLSIGSASSVAARLLARNENLADIVGGYTNVENINESDPIILNMCQTNTMNLSKAFGYQLLQNLSQVNKAKYNDVQEAPFIVLKLPEIPSVLVETAFISNQGEERLLKSNRFKTKLAKAMLEAIDNFFQISVPPLQTPPLVIAKAEQKAQTEARSSVSMETVYKVKKGDNLCSIAKKYDTTVGVLLRLNDMKMEDPLYVGRILKIQPATDGVDDDKKIIEPSVQDKRKFFVYKVKKGDTLAKLARDCKADINELLRLNHMKISDYLLINQKLKLPKSPGL
jgi:N-acetylmuramoyl-L-alanine amidase